MIIEFKLDGYGEPGGTSGVRNYEQIMSLKY